MEIMLKGGIGNQLFQYAYALSQSKKLNTELKINTYILDVNPYKYTPYNNELIHFTGVTEEMVSYNVPVLNVVSEEAGGEIKSDSVLDGYYQGEQFFENIKGELRQKLKFKLPEMTLDDVVSIHARRGDYLNGDFFVDLSATDYYKKAVEYIKTKVKNPKFHIFSNDENWAKEYFSFVEGACIESPRDTIDDLYFMSICQYNITANSTYSWWAAWLNNNPNKIVIQPKNWYSKAPNTLLFKDSIVL